MADVSDISATRLQLELLKEDLRVTVDRELAVSLFVQDCAPSGSVRLEGEDDLRQQLQEQIVILTAVLDAETAATLAAEVAAQEAAGLRLARAVAAQEEWDARVLRKHDARLAATLYNVSNADWEEVGDTIEAPLDLRKRPVVVEVPPPLTTQAPGDTTAAAKPAALPAKRAREVARNTVDLTRPGSSMGSISASAGVLVDLTAFAVGAPAAAAAAAAAADKGKAPARACHQPPQQTAECAICFERVPLGALVAATLPPRGAAVGAAASSSGRPTCNHLFCKGCMRRYLQELVQAHRFPPVCPTPGCHFVLAHDDVMDLLREAPRDMRLYEQQALEATIEPARRVYCPFKDCSCLLEAPDGARDAVEPFMCPYCSRWFCLKCKIAGWHTGYTCAEFQALPPALRSAEDAELLRLSQALSWKRCPAPECGHMVERTAGCNHMRCRCGCDFCYMCGAPYRSSVPTDDNEHGVPGCACPLFAVPDEDDAPAPPAPAPAPLAAAAQRRPYQWVRPAHALAVRAEPVQPHDPMGWRQPVQPQPQQRADAGMDPTWPWAQAAAPHPLWQQQPPPPVAVAAAPVGHHHYLPAPAPPPAYYNDGQLPAYAYYNDAQLPGGPEGVRPARPFRGGRRVSWTRCRNSVSIAHCPRGQRCWFTHAEDD